MEISNKPYLVRAIHSWCIDCDYTPHILANADHKGVDVPTQYITDGQIVFNISPGATRDLNIGNNDLTFLANFGKKVVQITLPMESILAVYAYENGDGITFDDDEIGTTAIFQDEDLGLSVLDGGKSQVITADEEGSGVKETQKEDKKQSKKNPTLTILK